MMIEDYGNYPDLSKVRRTLVILFRNIGDVILATPVFTVLKNRFPDMTVDALVNSGTEAILDGNPHIGTVHVFNRPAGQTGLGARIAEERRLWQTVRGGRYDMTITLTRGDRGRLLGWASGAGFRVGAGRHKKFLLGLIDPLTHAVHQAPRNRHYVERHLDCLRHIGLFPTDEEKQPLLFEGEEASRRIGELLSQAWSRRPTVGDPPSPTGGEHPTPSPLSPNWGEHPTPNPLSPNGGELPPSDPLSPRGGGPPPSDPLSPRGGGPPPSVPLSPRGGEGQGEGAYIVIHPTSRWMFKCWPHEKIAELISRIDKEFGLPVALTSSPDPRELDYIAKLRGRLGTPVADLAGRLTLKELTALIRQATLFVGVDSAPMHMAAAVKTPLVALFGPSSEQDWGPWGQQDGVVTADSFSCRPCQRDGCGGGKISECLTALSVDTVFRAVRKILRCAAPAVMSRRA